MLGYAEVNVCEEFKCLFWLEAYENDVSEGTHCINLWSLFKCFSRLG